MVTLTWHTLGVLCTVLSFWSGLIVFASAQVGEQRTFNIGTGVSFPIHQIEEPLDNSTAPFVFNTLSGLLKQWPNTRHPNGHNIILGELEPFTPLYHARRVEGPPPSPEWFAFDPEMSFSIIASYGYTAFLHTYVTTRPARIIYFDGMSAALGEGWLDSQEVLWDRKGKSNNGREIVWFDDYNRAGRLCEWASTREVEGFVRMNTGFEVLWCNFSSPSIQLVSYLNITPPGTPAKSGDPPFEPGHPPTGRPGRPKDPYNPYQYPYPDPYQYPYPDPYPYPYRPPYPYPHRHTLDDEPSPPTHPPEERRPPRRGPGRDWDWSRSPLAASAQSEWARAASRRGTAEQLHVRLSYADIVSFYHPRLSSLADARRGQPMAKHQIWAHISTEDAIDVADEVDEVLKRRVPGSGMNWAALADEMVDYWADRIEELREILDKAVVEPDSNSTEAIEMVRLRTYTPLDPYMDAGRHPNSSGWELFFGYLDQDSYFPLNNNIPWPTSNWSAFDRCTRQRTQFIPRSTLTPQEELLHSSVETVQRRLCNDIGTIFAESMTLLPPKSNVITLPISEHGRILSRWRERVVNLMAWLDWPRWLHCDTVCESGSVCAMPMWPITWRHMGRPGGGEGDDSTQANPTCLILDGPNSRQGPF